jgi:hypothetical protein
MAITLKKKPELDLHGTRWVHFKLAKEGGRLAPHAVEEGSDLSLLVASIMNPLYQSHLALIQRHIARIDMAAGVGTREFDPAALGEVAYDEQGRLLVVLATEQLIKDWKGVQEAEEPGVPAEYTPARCKVLLDDHPELYLYAIQAGNDIAARIEQRAQETAGKS